MALKAPDIDATVGESGTHPFVADRPAVADTPAAPEIGDLGDHGPPITRSIAAGPTPSMIDGIRSAAAAFGEAMAPSPFDRPLPAELGRYTLLAQIGRGGMGRVFR